VSIDEAKPPAMKTPRRPRFKKEAVDNAPRGQEPTLHDAPLRRQ
jgi:hypothetical protein